MRRIQVVIREVDDQIAEPPKELATAAGNRRTPGRRWRPAQWEIPAAALRSRTLRDSAVPSDLRAGNRTPAG
jgi:hypothetical protein